MSDPKHTPGPWRIDVDEDAHVKVVRDSTGGLVAELFRRDFDEDPEHEANAKLIAAAPRLAAALERCADALDSFACDPPGFPSVEWTEEDAEAVREASAALREAGVS